MCGKRYIATRVHFYIIFGYIEEVGPMCAVLLVFYRLAGHVVVVAI
jgi:hypothetical protein